MRRGFATCRLPAATAAAATRCTPNAADRPRLAFDGRDLLLALTLALLAAVVRFWALGRYPPGLHYDEAYNALDALKVLQGEHHIFFGGNFGREPLNNYAIALAFTIMTPGVVAIRSVSAAVGSLAVAVTYGVGRVVEPRCRLPALLAALVQVALPWDLHMSRYGIRVEWLPLLGGAAVLFLAIGWRLRRWHWFVASGVFLGLSLYGYVAARLLPFVALPWCALALWRADRQQRRRLLAWFAITAATAIAVFAPLGLYFIQHPDAFTLRAGQVALRGSATDVARQCAANLWAWAKAMLVAGDTNPRNNLPGAAALTPWLVAPWIAGLAYCLRRWRQPEWALLPLWFAVMLLPSILSEYAPNFQRAVGAIPPLCLTVGIGLWQLQLWIGRISRRWAVGACLIAVLLLGASTQGLYQYFVQWGRSADLYYAFDEGIYQIGEYARDRAAAGGRVYISPVRSDHTTLHFLMRAVGEPSTFDGRNLLVLPPSSATDVEYIVITQEDTVTLGTAGAWFATRDVARTFVDRTGRMYAVALRVDSASMRRPAPDVVTDAMWEGGISLLGLDLRPDRERRGTVQAVFYWQAQAPLPEDYTSFIHLVGPLNAATGTPLWAGSDSMPGSGTYPTTRWSPGETIIEPRDLVAPEGLVDGDYYLEIGWYLLGTGQRLNVVQPYSESSLLVGPYHVENEHITSWPSATSPVSEEGPR